MELRKSLFDAYNLLDLESDANENEIEAAYEHLCRLYGSDKKDISIQLLEGEWSDEARSLLLDQINRAYNQIKEHVNTTVTDESINPDIIEVSENQTIEYSGNELRRIREEKGIGLHQIYKKTQLPYKLFANIEQEKYAKLPEPGLLRWYTSVYAKILGLDAKKVADDYMKRYRRWSKDQD